MSDSYIETTHISIDLGFKGLSVTYSTLTICNEYSVVCAYDCWKTSVKKIIVRKKDKDLQMYAKMLNAHMSHNKCFVHTQENGFWLDMALTLVSSSRHFLILALSTYSSPLIKHFKAECTKSFLEAGKESLWQVNCR